MISSRHEAADVLQRVAEKGQWGCWPDDVTCEQVGRALFRIAMNAHEENALAGILRGWVAAKRERGL
ncbi:hypothetical protein HY624_04345 [Candidatus Uhrbacteria bacterium]|nr:hypothetical protein [Candidatus Uhrbacteria bacterium]